MGVKRGITRARVVQEAADLADTVGFHRVTHSEVARALGVRTHSIYHHNDGLEDLRREVSALAARRIGERFESSMDGQHGVDALLAVAASYRTFALEHPGLYEAAGPAATIDADRAIYEAAPEAFDTVLQEIAALGVPADRQVTLIRSLRAAVHGFIDLERADGFGSPDELEASFGLLLQVLALGVQAWLDTTVSA